MAALGVALSLLAALAAVALGPDGGNAPVGSARAAGRPLPQASPGTSFSAALEVGRMLQRRALAILARDRAAFVATLDPNADPGFRAAQLDMFANLADVPLAHWEYALDPADTVPVPPSAVEPSAAETWAPRTELRYALAGVDTEPTARPAGYAYVRRGATWYLASDTALEPVGRPTWRGPWDFGRCVVARGGNGLVIGHPGAEQMVRMLAGEIDAGVDAVSAVWGTGWPRRVGVLVPANGEELRALVGSRFTTSAIAAITVSDRVDRAAGKADGQRVVFNPDSNAVFGPTALRVVLRHELTHVAARSATDDRAPLWLLEGFAEYVGYRGSGLPAAEIAPVLTAGARAGQLPDQPPADAAFRGPALALAYQQSWSLARYIAARIGSDGLAELYRSLAADPTAAEEPRLDQTLRATLGTDFAGLIAAWRADLSRL